MQFLASVGTQPEEHARRQPLEVDVTVWLGQPLALATAAADTVDYRNLYELTRDVVMRGHTGYLEEIAVAIAEGALQQRGVVRARVRVRKPHVPLPGPLHGAEVEIERATGA